MTASKEKITEEILDILSDWYEKGYLDIDQGSDGKTYYSLNELGKRELEKTNE